MILLAAVLLALNPSQEKWLQGYAIEICPDPPTGQTCRYHPNPDPDMLSCKLRIINETFNAQFANYKIRCVYIEGWYRL